MDKDYKIFLEHILDSIKCVESYIKNISKDQFCSSMQKQDSVIRRIEIIGEAANNLPEDFKRLHFYIPWRDIVDMRNVLIHEYFGIDTELVWKTITEDLPDLKQSILKILEIINTK